MRIGGSRVDQEVDNTWIVPYKKLLLRSMNCHCNVELCMSIKSIKYVLKGTYTKDVIRQCLPYTLARLMRSQTTRLLCYVSSNEAVRRILEFPIHERDPPVQQLAVHLENDQRVHVTEETAMDRASGDPPKTTLTEFLCPMSEK